MAELMDLVPREFKDDLSEAEKLILEKAPKGEFANCKSIDGKDYDVEKPVEWPECRTVRAKFLEWLLRDREAQELIHDKGVKIIGIRLADELDLACIRLPFPVEIFSSRFEGGLILYNADVQGIDLDSSFIAGMMADFMVMEGSLFLRNIISRGEMRMVGADIGGNLECNGGKFMNKEGNAFAGDGIIAKGTIFLDGIESSGNFRLLGADIGGDLDCEGAKFINEKGDAFTGDRLVTKRAVSLTGIKSLGEFRLLGADIGGNLQCLGAKFINDKGNAFTGDRIATKGEFFLEDIESMGVFRLLGANIGGNLQCLGAKFINDKGNAFIGDGISTKGNIFLKDIEAMGVFRLPGANIDSELNCTGAKFKNENGHAFSGDGIATKGDVFLQGIESKGEFRLLGANIGGDLYCHGASFQNKEETALRIRQATVEGRLCLNKVKKVEGKIDLSNTKAGAFVDDDKSWPDEGELILDGFEYGSFADDTPTDIETRLEWLKRQPQGEYIPQSYQQLAKVYRKMGRDGDAKKVLLEKERMRQKYGDIGKLAKSWGWFLDKTIGYGYRVDKALRLLVLLIVAGTSFFKLGDHFGLLQETKVATALIKEPGDAGDKFYPEFNSFFYSLDTFVPFLDLHQESYWLPDSTSFWGSALRFYFWFHIMAGWVFSTLLLATFTGLIRRE